MSDEDKNTGSAEAGSPNDFGSTVDPVKPGESTVADNKGDDNKVGTGDNKTINWETQYKELEKKFGEQGSEVGKWRAYFEGVNPLLTKLENQDELIRAIMDGKVDSKLAEAVLEGKVSIQDASNVQEAHTKVQEKMGEKEYAKATPEEITKLVEKEVNKAKGEFDKKLSEVEERQEFKEKLASFVSSTPDYPEYAQAISEYFAKNTDKDNIEDAYHIVKGIALGRSAEEQKAKDAAEKAKEIAANASGGSSQQTGLKKEGGVDDLIGTSVNPNSF